MYWKWNGEWTKGRSAGLAAAAPILWRAAVNALPQCPATIHWAQLPVLNVVHQHTVNRSALLAVADQYDGGTR